MALRPYEDTRAKRDFEQFTTMWDRYGFLVGRTSGCRYPIIQNTDVGIIPGYDINNRAVAGTTTWGKFGYDYQLGLYYLISGEVPEKYKGQIKPVLGEAVVYPQHVMVYAAGRELEADIQLEDAQPTEYASTHLYAVQTKLVEAEIPIVIWRLAFAENANWEQPNNDKPLRVETEHVSIVGSSAVYDNHNRLLVAAQIMPGSKEELTALRATLAHNGNKDWVTVRGKNTYYLRGAKVGYLTITASMRTENALGGVVILLHPLTGDPQLVKQDFFYVVTVKDEKLIDKFIDRLQLAIAWPIQPEWGKYLLEKGEKAGLVSKLGIEGDDFREAIRVNIDEAHWESIIVEGIKNDKIVIGG